MTSPEFSTIIQSFQLEPLLEDDSVRVVDCRFSLADVHAGRRAYMESHLPGAVYAHLDEDLSGEIVPGRTGRHPLPDVDRLARYLGSIGIDADVAVVAYDDAGGAFAARLWWLLKWMGHDAVAVLDGGWPRWQKEGRATASGEARVRPRVFVPNVRDKLVVDARDVERVIEAGSPRLVDARAPERYAGKVEPIDPVAGHIPGAVNCPYSQALSDDGRFNATEDLRLLLTVSFDKEAIVYCGSGVTAAHLALSVVHAGLPMPRLYAGSWSDWITDGSRPVERT